MGLFSKTDSSSPEFQQLASRWDGYLKKIEARYFEILQQADGPLKEVIDNLQYDTVVIHNIITALKFQTVTELSKKADDGWNKMKLEMEKIGASWSDISGQRGKADSFKYWMVIEFQKFETATFANAARKILDNVKKHIDEKKLHRCTQCGAELPIKVYSFMAVNLKCESCGSVNTYQPDDRIRALEYYVINNLAEEYALNEKLKARGDKNTGAEYYKKYYAYLMENIPEKKDLYQRDLDERLKWVNAPGFTGDVFSA
jgi:hypothetical protein